MSLLSVTDLKTYFHTRNGIIRAVDGISFSIEKGETLGIVGESGSGKSVVCHSICGLIPSPPGRIEAGQAHFDNVDLLKCTEKELRKFRGNRISIIFQDPMTCLNPYLKIGIQLTEPLFAHKNLSKKQARIKAIAGMEEVGIQDADKRFDCYPHQLSGGMRQRVMIAMAVITEPELLIADEPTTALDVTIQAQILELIKKLQRKHHTAVIFITHDLGVIAGFAERTLVMYGGKIMESGVTRDVYYSSAHPYTKALLESIPSAREPGEELYVIPGQPPDNAWDRPGCPFAPRCEYTVRRCEIEAPLPQQVEEGHLTACLRVQEKTLPIGIKSKGAQ